MNCNSNGRVNIMGNNNTDCFKLYDKIHVNDEDTFYKTAMVGNWDNSLLSDTFFSSDNINIIQNDIRAGVYNGSNKRFLIGKQDEDTLKMIMRSIFLQYSKNGQTHIKQQVTDLNKMVSDYAIPQVMGEAVGYVKYKNDASVMYTPIERPVSTQSFKTLEQKPWF